jgi:hypothetical protein
MRELGIALLVGGAAFLVSGLIFLVPTRLARSAQQRNVEESREEIDRHLRDLRRERGDLS